MEENNTTPTPMEPMSTQSGPTKSKAAKIIIIVLGFIIFLAAGGAAGYYAGQYEKDKAVDQAKSDAHTEAEAKKTSERPAHELTPAKPTTDATCNADELALSTGTASGGAAAGTDYYAIVLENTGDRTCELGGYPGVSLVDNNGNQIGDPADRTTGQEEALITIAPGGKVESTIGIPDSNNFSEGECKSGATKLRVYPPNDTGYLSVVTAITTWCPGFSVTPVIATE